MLKNSSFLIILIFLMFKSYQQVAVTNPQTPINNPVTQPNTQTQTTNPFQKFDNALLRNLQNDQNDGLAKAMEDKMKSQIFIWTCIGLAFILYFIVIALVDMPNPKSSILYAKYDTTRAEHEL